MMTDNAIIAAILGKPTFASLVVSESIDFTDLETTFPAASYTGRMAMATVGTVKIMMISNGTEWVPEGGQATLALSGIGYGIMPSGTVSAGASGHFVSGTALPYIYSAGLWMYFAANAIVTPNISAGFYWCVFSNTTTCTIYSSGPGSAAINFSVGGAVTGHTGEVTARSVDIPAGLMGAMGQLATDQNTSIIGNTNTKTVRIKLDSSNTCVASTAAASNLAIVGNSVIANSTSSVQISRSNFAAAASTLSPTRTTVDTTSATTYSLTLQMAAATDYIINHSFRLDLFKV